MGRGKARERGAAAALGRIFEPALAGPKARLRGHSAANAAAAPRSLAAFPLPNILPVDFISLQSDEQSGQI